MNRNFQGRPPVAQHHGPARITVDPRRLRIKMVREQVISRGITDPEIVQAMSTVPRHLFVPEAFQSHAYDDTPLPIGYGQTISQPYTVALMTQKLALQPGMRVLEIGAGSGYQAAILAAMGSIVHAVERIRELYSATHARLRRLGLRAIHLHVGDGTVGLPQFGPFERILVSAGGPAIPPPLFDQLSDGGILLIPVGPKPRHQRLLRIYKKGSQFSQEDLGRAEFVDLVGDHGW